MAFEIQNWEIWVKDDIIKLFRALWCQIAWEEEIKNRYARIISDNSQIFTGMWIQIVWNSYSIVWKSIKADKWGKINDRNLSSFPHRHFNIHYWIGDSRGLLKSRAQLLVLFETLGFKQK